MNKFFYALLLILFSLSSVYSQHKIKETFSETAVPLVEIYSEKGDLLGISDVNGVISLELENKIHTAKATHLTFVNTAYKTAKLSIEAFKNSPEISLNRLVTELKEVVIKPNTKAFKYLKLKGYFRSVQINANKPHYFMDGIVEYYIHLKSGKVKMKIIANRSFENKSIAQLGKSFHFMVAGVPNFDELINIKKLNAKYDLKTETNQKTIVFDKEMHVQKGTIATVDKNVNLQLQFFSPEQPKIMKLLGKESHLNNYAITAIYQNSDIQEMNLESIVYFKELRSYAIKNKQTDPFQKVDATHEFYVVDKEYVDEMDSKKLDYFYSFKRPSHFEANYWDKVANDYFQPLPESITTYIKENAVLVKEK